MANNSAKQNEREIRGMISLLNWVVYGMIIWCVFFNTFYLIGESVSIWHYILVIIICGLTHLAYKQIVKCWELQLPT